MSNSDFKNSIILKFNQTNCFQAQSDMPVMPVMSKTETDFIEVRGGHPRL